MSEDDTEKRKWECEDIGEASQGKDKAGETMYIEYLRDH